VNQKGVVIIPILVAALIVGFVIFLLYQSYQQAIYRRSSLPGHISTTEPYPVESATPDVMKTTEAPKPLALNLLLGDTLYEDIKQGDILNNLEIVSIKARSKDNVTITFKGQATVTGEYIYTGRPSRDRPCFHNLTEDSQKQIPRLDYDERDVWFCFIDSELVSSTFDPKDGVGITTVVIDDYKIDYYPAEVVNTASLVSVISKD
jgi:hypothetical protein